MKQLVIIGIVVLLISCTNKVPQMSIGGLVKISLTDSSAKAILADYINTYSFDGKGVYLLNIQNYNDSVKYYVGIAFNKEDIKILLRNAPYYFYEIQNQRIVIIDTKLENFIGPQNCEFDSDTILDKFYDTGIKFREAYFKEFIKVNNKLSTKVIHFNPF